MTSFPAVLLLIPLLVSTDGAPAEQPSGTVHIDEALARSVVDRISLDVERIRARAFKTAVPVSVVSDEQAISQNLALLEEEGELDTLRSVEVVMKLMGLADPDADVLELFTDAMREQIGGYYDTDTAQFYLLDDMPAALVDVLTAHELTHALEDQHFDLDRLLRDETISDDRRFARQAVIEGSATLLMSIYTVELAFTQAVSEEAFDEMREEAVRRLPSVLLREMMAPYTLGLSFVQRGNAMAWMAGGFPVADVDRLYDAPPASSEQILHPEKYWDEEHRDDPVEVSLGSAGAALGSGWSQRVDGVLGEINVAVLVGAGTPDTQDPAAMIGSAWTHRAAEGWGGDRYALWAKGRKRVVLLSTVWDTEQDAQQFQAAIEERYEVPVERRDRAVALLFGKFPRKRTPAVLDALLREASRP